MFRTNNYKTINVCVRNSADYSVIVSSKHGVHFVVLRPKRVGCPLLIVIFCMVNRSSINYTWFKAHCIKRREQKHIKKLREAGIRYCHRCHWFGSRLTALELELEINRRLVCKFQTLGLRAFTFNWYSIRAVPTVRASVSQRWRQLCWVIICLVRYTFDVTSVHEIWSILHNLRGFFWNCMHAYWLSVI
jgi:hypothetical protein